MTDAWLRFVGLLVPQLVILAGLWLNRRPVKVLDEKVDELNATMIRHLESHARTRR